MKLKITFLGCLFLMIACSTEEFEINEVETVETISLNQRIVNQLNESGFESILTEDNKIVSAGFKNTKNFISQINDIYDILGETDYNIDINVTNSENAKSDTQCEQGSINGNCATYVCWGTALESVSMGSVDGVHYVYWTSCY